MKAKGHVPLRPGRSIKLPTGRSNRSWSWGTWHYCHVHKPNTCFLKANGTWGKPIEYSRAPRGSRQRSVWQRERFQHSTTDSIGKEEIKSLFQQEIADNVLIVLKDVRPKLSTSLTLRKLMPYKEMVRRVANCMRYFQTKEPRKELEELPESGKPSLTSTWVASSTETLSSQKCAWSKEHAAIIAKYFVTLKKAISIHSNTSRDFNSRSIFTIHTLSKNPRWRLPKFDMSKHGQDYLMSPLTHPQTSFPGPFSPYTRLEKIQDGGCPNLTCPNMVKITSWALTHPQTSFPGPFAP